MRRVPGIVALAAAGCLAFVSLPVGSDGSAPDARPAAATVDGGDAAVEHAYAKRLGKLHLEGRGTVTKLLADDHAGSRHQRFILLLASGRTLLVAHNIDLAPRIDSLHVGDTVAFYGEYEWSRKGGVIHWTHRDPQGRHAAGWLWHAGQLYQ
jgi:hypothetical protein